MSRPAKPYLERDWYVTRAGGTYHKLCHKSEGRTRANQLLREYLATLNPADNEKAGPGVGRRGLVGQARLVGPGLDRLDEHA
jgi:hypothetical protein